MEVCYGHPEDITLWMTLVQGMRDNFPGLETEKGLEDYRQTALRFMAKRQAICVKQNGEIAGVLLFSRGHNMVCCLAVSPSFRRGGVASLLMEEALSQLDRGKDITVTTFREEDPLGRAPRALYRKFGFVPGAFVEEFGYPNQEFVLYPKGERQ